MKTPIKLSALSFGAALLMFLWAPSASAFDGFDDGGGAGVFACAACHADLQSEYPAKGWQGRNAAFRSAAGSKS